MAMIIMLLLIELSLYLFNIVNSNPCIIHQIPSECKTQPHCDWDISSSKCICASIIPQDVVIIMDSSPSVEAEGWEVEKQFVIDLISTVIPSSSSIGIIQFATYTVIRYELSSDQDRTNILDIVSNLKQPLGLWTHIKDAVNESINLFKTQSVNPQRQLVLITDGDPRPVSQDPCDPITPLRPKLDELAVDVMIIGVGASWTRDKINCLVETAEDIIEVDSFTNDAFYVARNKTYEDLCSSSFVAPPMNCSIVLNIDIDGTGIPSGDALWNKPDINWNNQHTLYYQLRWYTFQNDEHQLRIQVTSINQTALTLFNMEYRNPNVWKQEVRAIVDFGDKEIYFSEWQVCKLLTNEPTISPTPTPTLGIPPIGQCNVTIRAGTNRLVTIDVEWTAADLSAIDTFNSDQFDDKYKLYFTHSNNILDVRSWKVYNQTFYAESLPYRYNATQLLHNGELEVKVAVVVHEMNDSNIDLDDKYQWFDDIMYEQATICEWMTYSPTYQPSEPTEPTASTSYKPTITTTISPTISSTLGPSTNPSSTSNDPTISPVAHSTTQSPTFVPHSTTNPTLSPRSPLAVGVFVYSDNGTICEGDERCACVVEKDNYECIGSDHPEGTQIENTHLSISSSDGVQQQILSIGRYPYYFEYNVNVQWEFVYLNDSNDFNHGKRIKPIRSVTTIEAGERLGEHVYAEFISIPNAHNIDPQWYKFKILNCKVSNKNNDDINCRVIYPSWTYIVWKPPQAMGAIIVEGGEPFADWIWILLLCASAGTGGVAYFMFVFFKNRNLKNIEAAQDQQDTAMLTGIAAQTHVITE